MKPTTQYTHLHILVVLIILTDDDSAYIVIILVLKYVLRCKIYFGKNNDVCVGPRRGGRQPRGLRPAPGERLRDPARHPAARLSPNLAPAAPHPAPPPRGARELPRALSLIYLPRGPSNSPIPRCTS